MAPRKPKAPDTTTAKPTTAPASAAKAKPKVPSKKTPALKVVAPVGETVSQGAAFKVKDLLDAVAAATGAKKPEVKTTVEATLAALGEAIATGRLLTLPPLGKLRVVKAKGPAITLKLRPADGTKAAGLALADDAEDS